jgi:hypothetical protein
MLIDEAGGLGPPPYFKRRVHAIVGGMHLAAKDAQYLMGFITGYAQRTRSLPAETPGG